MLFFSLLCDGCAGICLSHIRTTCGVSAASCDVANSNKRDGLACQCSDGYKGEIIWDEAKASGTCIKTQCSGTPTLQNGNVVKDHGNDHGSTAFFECNTGYVLSGPQSITCDAPSADGCWPTSPTCTCKLVDVTLTFDSHFSSANQFNNELANT